MLKGNAAGASSYLLAAGHTTGSPHLDTFGPNMALARDLLVAGQQASVLAYLDLCAAFWKEDNGALSRWRIAVQSGKVPDFGANLSF